MLETILTLGLLTVVNGEDVASKSVYGNHDMYAESTIVQQGYAYPGFGGQGIGYGGASSVGFSGRAAGPFYGGVEKFTSLGGGIGAGQGGFGGGQGGGFVGAQGGGFGGSQGGSFGGSQGGFVGAQGGSFGGAQGGSFGGSQGGGGFIGGAQGGAFYPGPIKYTYGGVEPAKFVYGGAGGVVTPVVIPSYQVKPGIAAYGGPVYFGGAGGGSGGIGGAGLVGGGLGGGGIRGGGGFIGAGIGPVGGGEYINKNIYGADKKELKDAHYENTHGKKGEEFEEGQEGFKHGKTAVKDIKKDQAYYSDEEGGKKLAEDAKVYEGGHHYNQEGKNGEEKKLRKNHRKGHVIKGFKKSHHKDESGKTEEFYDEEHDEGEQGAFDGQSGSFGEKESSSFKGAHEDGEFKAKQGKKEGHYDAEHVVDHNGGDGGQYSNKKYGGSGSVYGVNNGVDEQSLLGHEESKKFIKHHPGHVPFFSY